MLVGGNYYALQLAAQNTNIFAFYFVNLATGAVTGSAVTIHPNATNTTYVAQSDVYLQFQAPAARQIGAGLTVVTSDSNVAGTLGVSPALSLPVVLQCYGAGKILGTVTLPAGKTEVPFEFKVTAEEAIPADQVAQVLEELAPRP